MQKWEYFEQLGSLRARVPYSFLCHSKLHKAPSTLKTLNDWVNEWVSGSATIASFCLYLVLSGLKIFPFFFFFFNPDLLTFASWHFPFHFSLSFRVQLLLSVSVSLLPSFLCQFLFFLFLWLFSFLDTTGAGYSI